MKSPLPAQLHELTALRFFAALAVVHVHLPRGTFPRSVEEQVWSAGHLGVDLFFVLSGFIMAHAYPDSAERPLDYRDFLRNRIARVLPLHWFMCLLFLIVFGIKALSDFPQNAGYVVWGELPAHIMAVHSMGITAGHSWNFPSWSISAEMIAYTLLPVFLVIGRRLPAWVFLAATMMVLSVTYLVLQANDIRMTRLTYDFGVIRAVLGFAIGVALLHVIRITPNLGAYAPFGFFSTVAVIGLGVALRANDLWILLLLVPLIGFGAGLAQSNRPSLLRHPVLIWLGERSYAIYMVHVLVIALSKDALMVVGLLHVPIAVYLFNVGVIIFAAHVLYTFVECPARTWLRSPGVRLTGPSTQ